MKTKGKNHKAYIFVEQTTNEEIIRYLDCHIHGDRKYKQMLAPDREGSKGLFLIGVSVLQDKTVLQVGHTILWIYLTTMYHVYLKLKMLYFILCVKVSVAQSCLTLCDPMDWGLPGSSVHGILQKTILEWVSIPFSRGIFPSQGSNPGLLHAERFFTD